MQLIGPTWTRGKVFQAISRLSTTLQSTHCWTFIVLQFLLDHKNKGTTKANVQTCWVLQMQSARGPQFALLRPLKMICGARLRGQRSLPRYSKQQAPSSSCQQVFEWTGCPGNMWDLTAPSARRSPTWASLAASHCVVGHHCGQKLHACRHWENAEGRRQFNRLFKEMQTYKCLHEVSSSVRDTYIFVVTATRVETGL